MTEKGRGGGDLVETFDLHKITSLPNFSAPKSSERTRIYSACILSVRLRCQRHGQLMFRSQLEGQLTGEKSIESYLGKCCNFNIIFHLVVEVEAICGEINISNPYTIRRIEMRLMIELDLYLGIFHGTTKF